MTHTRTQTHTYIYILWWCYESVRKVTVYGFVAIKVMIIKIRCYKKLGRNLKMIKNSKTE